MGIRIEDCTSEQFLLCLDPAVRRAGGKAMRTAAEATAEGQRSLEREEQRIFNNELLRRGLPFYWHRTDKPTGATAGTPDFIVGINEQTLWIEFKLPGRKLSEEQEKFRERLRLAGITLHIVYSAAEAISLLNFYMI